MLFLPKFPKVPGVGDANALTLNQWSMVWPPGTSRRIADDVRIPQRCSKTANSCCSSAYWG